jgi:molecular chaperone DnaJ
MGGNPFSGFAEAGFGDLFEMFFGGAQGGGGRRKRPSGRDGEDVRADLTITLKDVLHGAEKTIQYSRSQVCQDCRGIGSDKGEAPETCTVCQGAGVVNRIQNSFIGQIQTSTPCSNCSGNGTVIKTKCSRCKGQGTIAQKTELTIQLPPGLEDGVTLHYPGKGGDAVGAGRPGDLYVVIEVAEDSRFVRKGADLFTARDLSFATAALGGKVTISGLEGDIEVTIPEGTQPGKVFRIPKKGVVGMHRTPRGDLFVEVDVVVPQKLSAEQKELIRKLDDSLTGKSGSASDSDDNEEEKPFLGNIFKKKK